MLAGSERITEGGKVFIVYRCIKSTCEEILEKVEI